MQKSPKSYLEQTRGILYSYLIAIPLLIAYEILILVSQPSDQAVRISIDIWFKTIFQSLGVNAISATLIVAAFVGAIILYVKRAELPHLKKIYFLSMVLESAVYAVLVTIVIIGFLETVLMLNLNNSVESLDKIQLFALSLGAGLYEELFFRVILVGGLSYLFMNFFSKKATAYIIAALIAALIFSGVHYIGQYGDLFTLDSFLFRFLFGLALNLIYVTRGFGIAAWTHALYDIFVISQM
ncbi:MAG: CPBP family glutamic-type intramembrane protease [Balneolaceae bacterium]|nr:CPBP family glutamic-type intramembrane protease [Balneolaceae bacterium]